MSESHAKFIANEIINSGVAADVIMIVLRAGYVLTLKAGQTYFSDDRILWQK